MTTRLAILACAAAACSSPSPSETPLSGDAPASTLAGARPNVLLILLDAPGSDDLGIHGNDIVETPHIDALAPAIDGRRR